MVIPTPITIDDYLDWADRHDVKTDGIPRADLEEAIDRGNRIEQEDAKKREARREANKLISKPEVKE